jgi:hypothetical protein
VLLTFYSLWRAGRVGDPAPAGVPVVS